jgi:hypothetical protein
VEHFTVGGERLIFDPRRSWGQVLECRRIGSPPPGVPPGELAHEGAILILGVIKLLSESRRVMKLPTFRKLPSPLAEEVDPKNQLPAIPAADSRHFLGISLPSCAHCTSLSSQRVAKARFSLLFRAIVAIPAFCFFFFFFFFFFFLHNLAESLLSHFYLSTNLVFTTYI